ncbi:hypothetical protein K504DRAFT_460898 [Pleomassaria siparia CBS 279.74]|uniref:NTF2 domain-containing protein n=1 Tax=Pleomassaria siparia CBS 279.74 TaxID=1314801 RepID=A0A6G1JXQ5_9PLEO|nr:hypothetical protein K504DRAFT_460898 [Pleomassaria siparia CBS 279.74]
MSLSAKYQAFLNNPSAGALADNATLHYVPTLTSINDGAAIMKHLAVQDRLIKKTGNKVLNVVEGAHELALDVETTLEFISGGGAYLPGLDDNFVSDRIVSFPMVHIVHFDKGQKIVQIRLYWDQGSLLKQIDVIGARARNWPIRDGKDQTRLVANTAAAVAQPASAASSRRSTTSRGSDEVSVSGRPVSSRSAIKDPHATLALFQPRDVNQEQSSNFSNGPAAPRATSLKPAPRDYSDLFAGAEALPSGGDATAHKQADIPAKAGGGKNFKPNRLFEQDTEEESTMATPVSSVKTNSSKYNHFDFAQKDDDDEATPKVREAAAKENKHGSQWNFEDFVTPEKTKMKILPQAVRHIAWSDDEEEVSPVRRPVVHKARPDADPHFAFEENTPAGQKVKDAPSRGRLQNKGMGLYKDHVTNTTTDEDDGSAPKGDNKHALGDVTTAIKTENRNKDFGAQWEVKDDQENTYAKFNQDHQNATEDRKQGLKGMDPSWGHYEQSPDQPKKPKGSNRSNGIKTTGNGMGGRNDVGRGWGIGDSDDEAPQEKPATNKAGPTAAIDQPIRPNRGTGINIAGNGMGGRSSVNRGWGIGESDEEAEHEKPRAPKAAATQSIDQPIRGKENSRSTGIKTSGNGMGGRSDVSRGWGIGESDDETEHEKPRAPKTAATRSIDQPIRGNENSRSTGIKTSGNGMGGRSDVSRGWGIGESDDETEHEKPRANKTAPTKSIDQPIRGRENSRSTGIKTSGNGMGGRSNASRGWGIGESDDETEQEKPRAGKAATAGHKGFWDF